jgi:S-adenosylmethionine synthetase
MSVNLIAADRFLFTSESVSEGHPDKVCDQISYAVFCLKKKSDPNSRVACEVAASNKGLYVLGEVTSDLGGQDLDSLVVGIVRSIVAEIGYTGLELGMDAASVPVKVLLNPQSADIAQGVNRANPDEQGAGDQGMMFGYACRETEELMPLPITLAHRLTHRLSQVRKTEELPFLRPDGKSQVTVEYRQGRPERVTNVVIAAQHDPDVSDEKLNKLIERDVVGAVIDDRYLDGTSEILINGTGRFVDGGPGADAGLTGRKIIVDTYGGMARHGGGAFSGKDPSKVDRSGAYMSRYVAKNLVAAGLADRAEVQLAYCIGVAEPVSVNVETFGTSPLASAELDRLVRENFDLRPQRIITDLDLRRPIYRAVAAYGHFGRPDLKLPWERTDRAASLRKSAGLT